MGAPGINDGIVSAPMEPLRLGKYTLLTKLAAGGMGEVYVAHLEAAAGFEKQVVIKRLLPQHSDNQRMVEMFLTEARVTAQLNHANICQVFELIQQAGHYYLVMEYLEGMPLSKMMQKYSRRGLDIRVAAGVIAQACQGLAHAHEFRDSDMGVQGIIHRDVSPNNLLVTESGVVKLLDFGIAKINREDSHTVTGSAKGKYSYMSPEQVRCERLDSRADIFSLGIVLFEALTGVPLFRRDSGFDSMQAIVSGERPLLRELRPEVPRALEHVVDRALSVDRDTRYPSARAFGEAITGAVRPLGGPATIVELSQYLRSEHASQMVKQRARVKQARHKLNSGQFEQVSSPGHTPAPELISSSPSLPSLPLRAPDTPAPVGPGTPAPRITGLVSAVGPAQLAHTPDPTARSLAAVSLGVDAPTPSDASLSGIDVQHALRRRPGWLWLLAGLGIIVPIVFLAGRYSTLSCGDRGASASHAATAAPDARAENPATVEPPAPPSTMASGSRDSADPSARSDDTSDDTARNATSSEPGADEGSGDNDDTADQDEARTDTPAVARPDNKRTSTRRKTGYLTIDSTPYAEIYVGRRKIGVTPLYRIPLSTGRHTVKAVTARGEVKRFKIKISPNRTTKRRVTFAGKGGKP